MNQVYNSARGTVVTRDLSKGIFLATWTSTGSEVFSIFICLDANKFVLLSVSNPIRRFAR